ncbi:hypothetical protein PF005_g21077 [Phytophthora fragariae]|uniref:RxLR effector protein n=1 Tax=Phytophthora fragariae TaxID=53985 RepID=A0A6A3ZWS1_9STRA|nr:hypothetical protein PF005_g21077 [Phytophthora fragariae]KAE9242878.1 hypothetical protein PF002_g8523 [Phytophthora fragariae]
MVARWAGAAIFWAAVESIAVARTPLATVARCVATLDPSARRLSAAMGTVMETTVKTAVEATVPITTLPNVLR